MSNLKNVFQRYKKEELVFLIEVICRGRLSDADLVWAINELENKKELQRIDEAEKYGEIASKKCLEYLELIKSINGKPIKDIPMELLEKADKLRNEWADADKKSERLMRKK